MLAFIAYHTKPNRTSFEKFISDKVKSSSGSNFMGRAIAKVASKGLLLASDIQITEYIFLVLFKCILSGKDATFIGAFNNWYKFD